MEQQKYCLIIKMEIFNMKRIKKTEMEYQFIVMIKAQKLLNANLKMKNYINKENILNTMIKMEKLLKE